MISKILSLVFISYLAILLFGCNSGQSQSTINQPNGWYFIENGKSDSIAKEPFVTVRDFQEIHMDSLSASGDSIPFYIIAGKIKPAKLKEWGDNTEKAANNKQSIGFMFNGKIITNPYPNFRLEGGTFSIEYTDDNMYIKEIYNELLEEMKKP